MARLTEEELKLFERNIKTWEKACNITGPIKDIRALIAEIKACWEEKHADKEFYWQEKEEGDK